MKKVICISILFSLFILINKDFAQQQTQTSKHATKEDSAAFNALVMYPDSIRLDIFQVCEYPAAIVNMATLQKNSSSGFSDAISSYTKDEQEQFWNLSRYGNLISDLAQGGKKSKENIDKILVNYPEEIRDTAEKYGLNYYETLKKINDLQTQTNNQFEQILSDYPPYTQQAIEELTQYPEIISLLNEHLDLTVRIGDHFKRDSLGIIHRMDSLNIVETKQNADDAAAWKQNLQQNPDDASDLKSAANEYATENGYTQQEINTTPSQEYVSNYTCTPYSYWFGYPTWYPYSYWYPYPYWYDCGYYYDPYGNMIIIGHPSYYFTTWYYYYPAHQHNYPHLCNSYVNYYFVADNHGHRRTTDANSVIVQHWVKDNSGYLPKDFLTNNTNRANVIKQVGQLNEDLQNENKGKTITLDVKQQYFQNNQTKYPALNTTPQTTTVVESKQQTIQEVQQQPTKQPPVKISQQSVKQPPVKPKQNNTTSPKQNTSQSTKNFNNMNQAQEYHKQSWEQTQPKEKSQPNYQQQQQQQPQKQQQQQQQQQQPKQQQQQQQQQPVKTTSPGKNK